MSDSKPSVYLAGPVMDTDDGGHTWRDYVQEQFGTQYDFVDPLAKCDVPAGDVEIVDGAATEEGQITVGDLVSADRAMVRDSDAVLVGWKSAVSVGTPMEAMYAYELDIPVVLWDRFGATESPWWEFHATVCDSLRGALQTIDEEVRR